MKTRDLILASLFTALTAVGAFVRIPAGVSYITLQLLFTLLAGILLGAKLGALSQAAYVILGLVGIPVFTGGGGISYLLTPTCGFLFGLIAMAWVAGRIAGGRTELRRLVPACLAGLAALYAVGLPYMYLILNLYLGRSFSAWDVVQKGMLIFLPGDFLKIAVACALARKLLPVLRKTAR
ncbi:biotin transporter BioY [Papillibacter cinnamivorans]|uniref:Biotin transporter n=1 Tax=Papillibacter cinnamivorans DSM 12816 TaxID=1122930 RepID=A0A1W2A2X2_9FIRM|nr:biotin transporter BioY [Papillibacter cinnamivorans]SMC55089.1 biotin transport system substrate-specific component [Papillibacter cinnamivorans DSM 12816]